MNARRDERAYRLVCERGATKQSLKGKPPTRTLFTQGSIVRLLTHLGLPSDFPKFRPAPKASITVAAGVAGFKVQALDLTRVMPYII